MRAFSKSSLALLLDVMLHVLGKHLDLGVEHFAIELGTLQLGHQALDAGMFNGGLGHQHPSFKIALTAG